MTKPKVYITRAIPEEAIKLLATRCEVVMHKENTALPKEKLLNEIKGCYALIVSGVKIDAEICEAIKSHCKIILSHGVGYDNIDVETATKHGIFVTNNPDSVTDAAADLAFALLLTTARRIIECDKYVREGNKDWGPMTLLGSQVSRKTIGIIGAGRIGTAVGQRAKGFDMNILYSDIAKNENFEKISGGRYVSKEELLRESDFISIHAPLLPSTHHLISTNELTLMKKTAILINASRGPLVDEKALVTALKNKEIAGAGLDVFEREPIIEEGLIDLDNVVLTPHAGTSTLDTRILMGEGCAKNIFASLDGDMPPNCVNPQVQKNLKEMK